MATLRNMLVELLELRAVSSPPEKLADEIFELLLPGWRRLDGMHAVLERINQRLRDARFEAAMRGCEDAEP
jgi:hypothetical protein